MVVARNVWSTLNLYKKQCLQVITWNKKHLSKQVLSVVYKLGNDVFAAAIFKGLRDGCFIETE